MAYKVAADGGNSGIKVIVEGVHEVLIPNINADTVIDYRLNNAYSSSRNNGRDLLHVSITQNFDKGGKPKSTVFGAMAEKMQGEKANRESTNKCNDERLIQNILISIAYSIISFKESNNEELSKEMTLQVDLSTGLPYQEWSEEHQQKRKFDIFRENLKGNHKITFKSPYFLEKGVENVELVINKVEVGVEGSAALSAIRAFANDDIDQMTDEDLIEKAVVVVDIGAFTTELIGAQWMQISGDDEELECALTVYPHISKGIDEGVGLAMDKAIEVIKLECDDLRDNLIRRDIERAYTTPAGKKKGVAGYIPGKDINVNEWVYPAMENLGETIARKFYGFYNTRSLRENIIKIYVCGGGSQFEKLANKFKEVLVKDGYSSDIIVTVSNPKPIFANAYGYYAELVDVEEEIEE